MNFKNFILILVPLFGFNLGSKAQFADPKLKLNYELRNQDFLDRREGKLPVNFAREYQSATKAVPNYTHTLDKAEDLWTPIGPFGNEALAGTGRVNNLQFHPTDTNTWYICVAQGGLWKTTNAGQSWIPISGDLPILRTSCLAIDPTNPDVMYVALGDYAYLGHNLQANENKRNSHYGIGVYFTTDGGTHWQPTGLSFDQLDFEGSLIARIIIHKSDPSKLIAVGQTGAFVSDDKGQTWQKTNNLLFRDLEQDPKDEDVLFASTGYVHAYKIGEAAILKSSDFGKTWTESTTNIPRTNAVQRIELAIAPSDPDYVYALACDTIGGFYGFYKSTNHGESFAQILDNTYPYNILNSAFNANPGGQGSYDLAICVDRLNKEHVLIGGINIWHTQDGGQNFEPLTFWRLNYNGLSLHADIHEIKQHPANRSVFACHDGGISRTFSLEKESPDSLLRNKVKTQWTHYTKGLNITSFYRIAVNRLNSREKIAGAQDNSTVFTDGTTFENLSGGDGMEAVFMDAQNYRYTSSQNGTIYTYQLEGETPRFIGNLSIPNQEKGEWTTPMVYANQKLYVLFENLYSYVGRYGGGKHSEFSSGSVTYPKKGTAMDIKESDGNTMYIAKRGYNSAAIPNEIWRSRDHGKSWTDIGNGLPRKSYPSYIEMSQYEPEKVWITFSNFDSSNKVFYSKNGGDTWENMTYDLPNIPVNTIVHQEDGSGTVYIGTDIGVFYLKKDSSSWQYYSKNLPKVIVSELEIDTSNRTLVAATFGRGMWEVGLKDYKPGFVHVTESDLELPDMQLYPVPAEDVVNLKFDKFYSGSVQIKILDVCGRVCIEDALRRVPQAEIRSYDVADLTQGIYYVLVTNGAKRRTFVFYKE